MVFLPPYVDQVIRQIEVKTAHLDAHRNIVGDRPLVVKIDTEGHELSVLRGAEKLLTEHRDVKLLVEFNPDLLMNAGVPPEELLKQIRRLGFEIHFIDDARRRILTWRDD